MITFQQIVQVEFITNFQEFRIHLKESAPYDHATPRPPLKHSAFHIPTLLQSLPPITLRVLKLEIRLSHGLHGSSFHPGLCLKTTLLGYQFPLRQGFFNYEFPS